MVYLVKECFQVDIDNTIKATINVTLGFKHCFLQTFACSEPETIVGEFALKLCVNNL